MESNEVVDAAEAALIRVRGEVEALQSEVSLRQQLLRRRKRALAGKERALDRTRKAWEVADQEVEQAEAETAAKLTEITGRRDSPSPERGRRRRSGGEREGAAAAGRDEQHSEFESEHPAAERETSNDGALSQRREWAEEQANRLQGAESVEGGVGE